MLRAPASRRSSTRQFGRVVAREGVVEQLLSLEAERRELRARLKANEERQRALAMGADVEDATPRTAADADACETAPSAWAEACDVDDVDGGAAAPRRGAAADESLGDFARGAASRGSWLVGLLAAQSLSSLVLERNADVIQRHPVIVRRAAPARSPSLPTRAFQVFFLTMLVGAGGNAGNQAAVRIIRGLATGEVDASASERTVGLVSDELRRAVALALILVVAGFVRVIAFHASVADAAAISCSLFIIVATSVALGTLLPLALSAARIDAAHASTTIQVVMDVLGVLITCTIAPIVFAQLASGGAWAPLLGG